MFIQKGNEVIGGKMTPDSKESSNFDIAYDHFRKQMEEVGFFSDEEIDSVFNQPREIQIGLRHEEDFE